MLPKLRPLALVLIAATPLALAACNEGPAERAGKDVDRVTGQKGIVTEGPAEKAGKDVDRTLGTQE